MRLKQSPGAPNDWLANLTGSAASLPPVGGRLTGFIEAWRRITGDQWVLEVVTFGYTIPLLTPPAFTGLLFTSPPRELRQVLQEEVDDLLRKGAIEQVPEMDRHRGVYSHYFLVPKKSGGWRPILNLKALNLAVERRVFRMETLRSIIAVIRPSLWLASLDLRDAYFHVGVRQADRSLLRFGFLGQCYQFKVLPFGLTTAPRTWTKVLAPVLAHLRRHGVSIYAYLDDLLCCAGSRAELRCHVELVSSTLQSLGFLINWKKSEPVPTQDLTFVGGEFNTREGLVRLPMDRCRTIIRCAQLFRKVGLYRPAFLHLRLLGLMAATLDVVPLARLYMRPLQWQVKWGWARQNGLRAQVLTTREMAQSVEWWTRLPNLRKGVPLLPPPSGGHDNYGRLAGGVGRSHLAPGLQGQRADPRGQPTAPSQPEFGPGGMERSGEHSPHKRVGAQSSETDTAGVRVPRYRSDSASRVRQLGDCFLHKQDGGRPLRYSAGGALEALQLADSQGDPGLSHPPCRHSQHSCGLSQSTQGRSDRMVPGGRGGGTGVFSLGSPPHRLVCERGKLQVPSVLQSVTDATGVVSRRLVVPLDGLGGSVCFSTLSPTRKSPDQDQGRQGDGHAHSSKLAASPVVFSTSGTLGRMPSHAPDLAVSPAATAPREGDAVSPKPQGPAFSSLEAEREELRRQGFSEQVVSIATADKRDSTRTVYDGRWAAFVGWCMGRGVDPPSAPVREVLDFLAEKARTCQCSTVRGYVTAISARHDLIQGKPLAGLRVVGKFLKGLQALHPPKRDLVPPWSLELVLRSLKGRFYEPLGSAALKDLTFKTLFLVAIASARRVSELQALCHAAPYLAFSSRGVTLSLRAGFIPKVSTPFNSQAVLHLPALHDERDDSVRLLCVRRALKIYLERTRPFRKSGELQLFVAFGRACRGQPVTKHTLSGWLVQVVERAYRAEGQDPPQGIRAHQTRHQSTSWADLAGVQPAAIMRAATWSSGCSFARHYKLDLFAKADSTFGRTVLSTAGASALAPTPAQPLFPRGYRIPRRTET